MRNPDGTYTHRCKECTDSFNTVMQLKMHIGHKHKRFSLNPFENQVSGSGE